MGALCFLLTALGMAIAVAFLIWWTDKRDMEMAVREADALYVPPYPQRHPA